MTRRTIRKPSWIQEALNLAPDEIDLRVDYALALRAAGSSLGVVKAQLLDAYKRLTPQADKKTREHLYNALTYAYVYLDPPEGFTNAIKLGEEYLSDPSNSPSADIYRTIAAAYGQQYKWCSEHPDPAGDLWAIRDKALAAVRSSVAIGPQ